MQKMGGHVLQIMAGDGACALLHSGGSWGVSGGSGNWSNFIFLLSSIMLCMHFDYYISGENSR